MSEQRQCIGFGDTEGRCQNKAGTRWSPYWCEACNRARMDHISAQLEKLTSRVVGEPDHPEPKPDGAERPQGEAQ